MAITAAKTTIATPVICQKTTARFFRKAGEDGFFSTKENSPFFKVPVPTRLMASTRGEPQAKPGDAPTGKTMESLQQAKVAAFPNKADEKMQRKNEEHIQGKQEIPLIKRTGTGNWIGRTSQNGCTSQRSGLSDTDRFLMQQIQHVAGIVDSAIYLLQGRLRHAWYVDAEEQDRIDYFFSCPTNSRLAEILADFVRLRAVLGPNYPYHCSAEWGPSGSMTHTIVPEYGEVPTGLLVMRAHFHDLDLLRGNILGVGIRLIGIDHRNPVLAYHRYIRRVPHATPQCRPPGPSPQPVVRTPETIPIPEPGERCQPSYVFLNNETRPTRWSRTAVWEPFSSTTCHTMGQPPDFVRLRGIPFNLNPDGTVTPRTTSRAADR